MQEPKTPPMQQLFDFKWSGTSLIFSVSPERNLFHLRTRAQETNIANGALVRPYYLFLLKINSFSYPNSLKIIFVILGVLGVFWLYLGQKSPIFLQIQIKSKVCLLFKTSFNFQLQLFQNRNQK